MSSARFIWFVLLLTALPGYGAARLEPGLNATYTSLASPAKIVRDIVASQPQCYVPAGQAPTPLLPPGRFNVAWRGFIAVDLRSEYSFQADVGGSFKLVLNGETVLDLQNKSSPLSKPVKLRKGTNEFLAILDSDPIGPTFLRLHWTDNQTALRPLPVAALSRAGDQPGLSRAKELRLGRELFLEYRCGKCHENALAEKIPEGTMDTPSLENIGARRKKAWLAEWVRDPHAARDSARMPAVLATAQRDEEAKAIAEYLASLGGDQTGAKLQFTDDDRARGEQLFQLLLCAGCHVPPNSTEVVPGKISLATVNAKFTPESLRQFLQKPERHFLWIRMPNFRLTIEECTRLAAYLTDAAPVAGAVVEASPLVKELRDRGEMLVQSRGCLNCHQLKLENQYVASSLASIPPDATNSGCLADAPEPDIVTPLFSFTDQERTALRAFITTDRESLGRHVRSEFAERQMRLLNCNACHGQHEGFPALDLIGATLKPEWITAFLAGGIAYKPRPWLEARMPEFPQHAVHLAAGLAMQHGFPAVTAPEPPVDRDAAAIGHKLMGKDGFSCISCHAVGPMKATEIFEGEGNDFIRSAERLQRSYFHRWLLDPLLIDPTTKMPDYFEGFTSPFTDVYGGDARKQIEAMWQYLRLGEKMPLPRGGPPQ